MNKKLWIFIIVIIIIAVSTVVVWSVYNASIDYLTAPEVRIFEDIDELAVLNKFKTNAAPTDEYIAGLQFAESYTAEVEYEGRTFYVWAYVFDDVNTSADYFAKISGRNSADIGNDYLLTQEFYVRNQFTAFSGNTLYRVYSNASRGFTNFVYWLYSSFSQALGE